MTITTPERFKKPTAPAAAKAAAADLDLVYHTARWTRGLFNTEAAEDGQLKEALELREEPVWRAFNRELFGRLYGVGCDRMEEPRAGAEWAGELHTQCDSIPEWQALQGRVHGDAWRASIGAAVAAQILAPRLPELPSEDVEQLEAELEVIRDAMTKSGGRKVSARLAELRGELQRRVAALRKQSEAALAAVQAGNGFAIRSGARQAAAAASQALNEVDDALKSLGGVGHGVAQRRAITKALIADDRLRRIAALAGRLRVQAAAKQRTKTRIGASEVTDVTQGADIARLLPSELLLLATSATVPLLYRHLTEKNAQQYNLRASDTKARGPIIFLIDTSGSMGGRRDEWAKACALAVMEIARIQKRAFAVVFFDDGIAGEYRFTDPANVKFTDLVECLGFFSGGGTNIAKALLHAHDMAQDPTWKPGPKSDVILVTDGEDGSDVATPAQLLKDIGASIYTIAIECSVSEELRRVSVDVTRMVPSDMTGGANAKLDGVFSI